MPKFSLEVVLRIVSHMDHYTVIAFLRALPQYTRYAVLVTDHEQCPLFFSIPTISRRYLPLNVSRVRYNSSLRERQIKNHELFTQEVSAMYPIRLYEIDDDYSFMVSRRADFSLANRSAVFDKFFPLNPKRGESEAELPLDPWIDNPGFNATSFVFLHVRVYPGCPYSLTDAYSLSGRIHSVTGAKCHVGSATCPREMRVSTQGHIQGSETIKAQSPVFSAVSLRPSCFINPTLVSVRLENVPVIAYLDLAHIIDLVLVYNDGSVHVPVIEGLVAPNVRRFVVHYDRQVPLFKKMGRLIPRMFDWEKKRQPRVGYTTPGPSTNRSFELCHIDSVGAAGCGDRSRDPSQVKPRSLADMSFTFLKRFHCVVLSGVPWHVVAQIAMKAVHRITVLDLELTETAQLGTDTVIEIPNLKRMIISLKADNLTLPVFRTPILEELYVRIMALNPNLEGLWQRRALQEEYSGPGLTHLEVQSLPGLSSRAEATGNRMYTVTEAERTAMEDMINHYSYTRYDPSYKPLILKGFE